MFSFPARHGGSVFLPVLFRERHDITRVVVKKVKSTPGKTLSEKPLPVTQAEKARFKKEQSRNAVASSGSEDFGSESTVPQIWSKKQRERYVGSVNAEYREKASRLKRILQSKEELGPLPAESDLLHWAGRQQIKYLHERNPDEWTADRIAAEFPISPTGAEKLLRSERFLDAEQIRKHDEDVDKRWRLLFNIKKSGYCPAESKVDLKAKTIENYLYGRLQHEKFKSGNPKFDRPSEVAGRKFPMEIGKKGKMFRIFEEYKNIDQLGRKITEESSEEQNSHERLREENVREIIDENARLSGLNADVETATRYRMMTEEEKRFQKEIGTRGMTIAEFREAENIETLPELGEAVPKKTSERKKSKETFEARGFDEEKPLQKIKKFSRAPRRIYEDTTQNGRNFYSEDGEVLYRY